MNFSNKAKLKKQLVDYYIMCKANIVNNVLFRAGSIGGSKTIFENPKANSAKH
jgi:hypothetical protein